MRLVKKLRSVQGLTGFYAIITFGMVVFSLLAYLPSEEWANDVTLQGAIWGMMAHICFVLLAFTYLLEAVYDKLEERRRK